MEGIADYIPSLDQGLAVLTNSTATSDPTSLLSNIIPDIQALTSLLQPEVVNDIKIVVVSLATVLAVTLQTKPSRSSAKQAAS